MLYPSVVYNRIKIVFLCMHSHAEIFGNEEVDWIAKLITTIHSFLPDSLIIKQCYLSNSISEKEGII